ncbi:MAG: ATP-dependent zinc metalloprotease FtsH [Patescibacteria group bacterium]
MSDKHNKKKTNKSKFPKLPKLPRGGLKDAEKNKKQSSDKKMKQKMFSQFSTALLIFMLIVALYASFANEAPKSEEVSISDIARAVQAEEVSSIKVVRSEITATYKNGDIRKAKRESDVSLSESLSNFGVTPEKLNMINITVSEPSALVRFSENLLPYLFPLLLLGLILYFLFRSTKGQGGGAMQAFTFGSSRARFIDPSDEKQKITFDDVAGSEEAKQDLQEIVEFLKRPKKFTQIGAEIPKGALLMGEPGTGKTLLARAVAGEAGVPFYSVSASEFVEMFVGVGASRVRDMFAQAKRSSPAIIFIDEIDAIGRVRGGGTGGGNDEREQTLNQILVEMDGFERNEAVIVLAATNRPEVLDPALLRPGRFDRRITIDLPDRKARNEILEIHSARKKMGEDVNLDEIARRTPGMSGADLYSVMNEAAIFAARDNRKQIAQYDIIQGVEKVAMGPERRSRRIGTEEKELTAYHEVGHAIIATVLEHADPVTKVTVIPRGRAMGYVYQTPEEDRYSVTHKDFLAKISVALAGYASERKYFDDVSTGPSNDLQQATAMARNMVTRYGMSDIAGVLAWERAATANDAYAPSPEREYSPDTAKIIDDEIKKIMDEQMKEVENLLDIYEDAHHSIAKQLLEAETFDREEFEEIAREAGVPIKNRAMRKPRGILKYTNPPHPSDISTSQDSTSLDA